MTVREVVTDLDKIMKELENVNIQTNVRKTKTENQKRVSTAYSLLDELKKKLKSYNNC